jgi:RNA polymerase sigma-70 factor, ECF subfamily
MVGIIEDIELCVPALRRYAGALLRDRAEADDLVHKTLVRTLDGLGSLRDHESVRVSLFATLHGVFAGRAWRSAGSGPAVQTENGTALALDILTQEERSILLLVCVEDFSYGEVSRVLSIPLSEVMTRLSTARQQLWQRSAAKMPPSLGRAE